MEDSGYRPKIEPSGCGISTMKREEDIHRGEDVKREVYIKPEEDDEREEDVKHEGDVKREEDVNQVPHPLWPLPE